MPRPVSPTHFICIPLSSPQLARTLSVFRSDVTSENGLNLPPAAIRPLGTMHLTLGVMALPDETSLSRARELLRQTKLKEHLRKARGEEGAAGMSTGVKVTLKGLQALHDPTKTTVVYAPPADDQNGLLYKFCKSIRSEFEKAGLVVEEKDRPLLLHATIVNTIYVPGQRGSRGKKKMTVDAREMLAGYDGFVWMENMDVDKVTLCKMGAQVVGGEDGERYEVVEEVTF